MSKTFCVLPHIHIVARVDGRSVPCCRFKDPLIFKDSRAPDEAFHSVAMKELRQKLDTGEKVHGCYKCYREEEVLGKRSLRQINNEKYQKLIESGAYRDERIRYLEVAFSNDCNFACRSCSGDLSTSWHRDEVHLSRGSETKRVESHFDFEKFDWSALEEVKLMGGESLIVPKNQEFLEHLATCSNLANLRLEYNTNISTLPSRETIDIWKKCRRVFVKMSLDGVGTVNEYIRHRSSWARTAENIHFYHELAKSMPMLRLGFHTVVMTYNIHHLNEMESWLKENYPETYWNLDYLERPYYLNIMHLPEDEKQRITAKYENTRFQRDVVAYMNNAISNPAEFAKLTSYTYTLDRLRGQDVASIAPEIAELLSRSR